MRRTAGRGDHRYFGGVFFQRSGCCVIRGFYSVRCLVRKRIRLRGRDWNPMACALLTLRWLAIFWKPLDFSCLTPVRS